MHTSRPGKKVSGKTRDAATGTIAVCTVSAEIRELAIVADAYVALALDMIEGDAPPDGEALYHAIRAARAATKRMRDLARTADNFAAGRWRKPGKVQ